MVVHTSDTIRHSGGVCWGRGNIDLLACAKTRRVRRPDEKFMACNMRLVGTTFDMYPVEQEMPGMSVSLFSRGVAIQMVAPVETFCCGHDLEGRLVQ